MDHESLEGSAIAASRELAALPTTRRKTGVAFTMYPGPHTKSRSANFDYVRIYSIRCLGLAFFTL